VILGIGWILGISANSAGREDIIAVASIRDRLRLSNSNTGISPITWDNVILYGENVLDENLARL
jgi:hypothetical protein